MMRWQSVVGVVLASWLAVSCACAQVPPVITYQGALTDAAGKPANGWFTMTFAMFSRPSGGIPKWSQTLGVRVTDGVFTALLGGARQPFPSDLTGCRFLEMSVGGTPLLPRQRLSSVLYALRAEQSETLAPYSAISGAWGSVLAVRQSSTQNVADQAVRGEATGTSGNARGVYGLAQSPGGVGVWGENFATTGEPSGVHGATHAPMGSGVSGVHDATTGVAQGVLGLTNSESGSGVKGHALATSGETRGVFGVSDSPDGAGVRGEAAATSGPTRGVYGKSSSPDGAGVLGENVSTSGNSVGVVGVAQSTDGTGVKGAGATGVRGEGAVGVEASAVFDPDAPGHFRPGTGLHAFGFGLGQYGADITCPFGTALRVAGSSVFTDYADFQGGHGDLAENYRGRAVEPGDVAVIGPDGVLLRCSQERDTSVAGIVSTQPSMKISGRIADGEGVVPLALVGRVLCKVTASNGPIRAGDLLTTSSVSGHAMKAHSAKAAAGAIIGKALEDLESGEGQIQVLVTLR